MRVPILSKTIFMIMALSLIPLAMLSFLSLSYLNSMERTAVEKMESMQQVAVTDSTAALNNLGADIIKNQAMAAKRLVELYMKTHPTMTAAELINDSEFQKIAIQPVGKKGYTTVILTKTQNMIAHPNPTMMGKDLLASMSSNPKMQDWWRVVKVTYDNNVDSSGYYQWPEADGTYSNKYMYLAVIDTPLQGQQLSIAATTYIDEFNAPAKLMDDKLVVSRNNIITEIQSTKKKIQDITVATVFLIFVAVVILSYVFSRKLTEPIKKLTVAGRKIADGDLKTELPRVNTNDEIEDLSATVELLVGAVRYSKEKKEKIKK